MGAYATGIRGTVVLGAIRAGELADGRASRRKGAGTRGGGIYTAQGVAEDAVHQTMSFSSTAAGTSMRPPSSGSGSAMAARAASGRTEAIPHHKLCLPLPYRARLFAPRPSSVHAACRWQPLCAHAFRSRFDELPLSARISPVPPSGSLPAQSPAVSSSTARADCMPLTAAAIPRPSSPR